MNELLVGLCSYVAFQTSQGVNACHSSVAAAYIQSGAKPLIDHEQQAIEKEGTKLYSYVPYNKPLGTIFFVGKELKEKDFKLPLTNNINLEYSNFNAYSCNLRWEF